MNAIHFHAVVGPDGAIHPPAGVELPTGTVEVIVKPGAANDRTSNASALTHEWLLVLAAEAEEAKPDLPTDLAEHHDHYAHGKPKS